MPETIHSFIVKVWVEQLEDEAAPVWRGHITHVPSGVRHYLQDLEAVPDFIAPYLESMGVRVEPARRACSWLHRRRPSS